MNKNITNSDENDDGDNNDNNYEKFKIINSIPNDNLMNIANTIDMLSLSDLNGTAMDMLSNNSTNIPVKKLFNKYNNSNDNETLIKSLTKEIITNLQQNKDITITNSKINNKIDELDELDESEECTKPNKKPKTNKKKEKFDNINSYYGTIFDSCFGIKDFILLFVIYFLLSQDMIKDFFSKYFTSLNADSDGKVNVQGVIIYGLILTVFFTMSRKFI
jgi:regulator of replication initiation timing